MEPNQPIGLRGILLDQPPQQYIQCPRTSLRSTTTAVDTA